MPPVQAEPSLDGADPMTFTLKSSWAVFQPPPMTFLPPGQTSVPTISVPPVMLVDALTVSRPLTPLIPGAPCGPVNPAGPAGPAGPTGPVAPVAPVPPVEPAGPTGPAGPAAPVAPVAPAGPAGPVAPVAPAGPAGPCGPKGPTGPCGPAGPVMLQVASTSLPRQVSPSAIRRSCPAGFAQVRICWAAARDGIAKNSSRARTGNWPVRICTLRNPPKKITARELSVGARTVDASFDDRQPAASRCRAFDHHARSDASENLHQRDASDACLR